MTEIREELHARYADCDCYIKQIADLTAELQASREERDGLRKAIIFAGGVDVDRKMQMVKWAEQEAEIADLKALERLYKESLGKSQLDNFDLEQKLEKAEKECERLKKVTVAGVLEVLKDHADCTIPCEESHTLLESKYYELIEVCDRLRLDFRALSDCHDNTVTEIDRLTAELQEWKNSRIVKTVFC